MLVDVCPDALKPEALLTTAVLMKLAAFWVGRPRSSRNRDSGQAGFALVEVMVSALLLIVLALATYPVIEQAASRSGASRSQDVASSLAQSDQERMRQMSSTVLANYRNTATKNVKGINYTIQSRADVVRDSSGIVACQTDNGRAEYFKISSTITWASMQGVDPVTVESIIAPGVAALGLSTVTVKLTNAAGGPQAGVPVTAGSLSGVTDAGGCVVFAFIDPGTVNVSWSKPGYVDPKGATNPTQSVSATATQTANVTGVYDVAQQINVNLVDATDSSIQAKWSAISAASAGPGFPTGGRAWTSASPASSITANNLFPFPTDAYGFYAGGCLGANPRTYGLASYALPSALATTTTPVTVTLKPIRITVTNYGTSGNPRVVIRPDTSTTQMTGCTDRVVTDADSTGKATAYLPWGRWIICAERSGGTRHRDLDLDTSSGTRYTYNNVPTGGNVSPIDTGSSYTLDVNSNTPAAPANACP